MRDVNPCSKNSHENTQPSSSSFSLPRFNLLFSFFPVTIVPLSCQRGREVLGAVILLFASRSALAQHLSLKDGEELKSESPVALSVALVIALISRLTPKQVPVSYKTWGTLNADGSNALFVCHALTGNASLDVWWGSLLGPGRPFDTDRFYVVCLTMCVGTCVLVCGDV